MLHYITLYSLYVMLLYYIILDNKSLLASRDGLERVHLVTASVRLPREGAPVGSLTLRP